MGKEFDVRSRASFCLVSMHQFTSKIIMIPSTVEVILRIYCMIRLQIMAKMWINIILVLTFSAYMRLIKAMETISWKILASCRDTYSPGNSLNKKLFSLIG